MNKNEIALEEIKLAQERILHNETLIWSIGSILNSSIFILFGISINNVNKFFPFIIAASILVSLLWILFEIRYRNINNVFYKRIQILEKELGMHLHSQLDESDKNKKVIINAHKLIIWMATSIPTILIIYCISLLSR
jgi:hypothetical protein